MKIHKSLFILLFLSLPLAAETGHVVKVQNDEVFIDVSEFSEKPATGAEFTLYEQGEELVNPATGKKLGAELKNLGKGVTTETHDTYAKGRVTASSAAIKPGVLAEFKAAAKPAEVPQTVKTDSGLPALPLLWESEPVSGTVVDVAPGDFDGNGALELAVAQPRKIWLAVREGTKLIELASASLPEIQRIISVETLKAGYAGLKTDALIINIFDSSANQIEAGVYTVENGAFVRKNQLKWMVRALNAANEPYSYYTQEIYQSGSFSLSFIKRLEYSDKFTLADKLTLPRTDWLYGLTVADLDSNGTAEAIYTTPGGNISVQFAKRSKHAETRTGFGRTPNRATMKGNQLFFPSRLPVVKSGKTAVIYGISNIPMHILSEAFGRYVDAELSAFSWNGATLTETSRTRLGGAVSSINYGEFCGLQTGLIIPVQTIDDSTIIKVFGY